MARGYIRQRGEAWEVMVDVGTDPLTGKRRRISRSSRGSKRDAERMLTRLLAEVDQGAHAGPDAPLSVLAERWQAAHANDWSAGTVRTTDLILRSYVLPTLGAVPLRRLRPADLDTLYASLRSGGGKAGRPLAASTVQRTHVVIHAALAQAVRWDWLVNNPADRARAPRPQATEPVAPSTEDVARVIAACEERDPELGVIVHLTAVTGARRGEVLALRWPVIDLEAGELVVARGIAIATTGLVEQSTKTGRARRIALDPETVRLLRAHRTRCREAAMADASRLSANGYVFARESDARLPLRPESVTRRVRRVRDAVGCPTVTLRQLRHYVATRLLSEGTDVRTVAGRLGHARASTTLDVYAHVVPARDRDAADTLARFS